ncbi:MAG TPA: ATP-binding protein [Bacteroidota bacterium]|nr:ATP-binding protein [Bacteroidota bacterium]
METVLRILLVEDSEDDAVLLVKHIRKGGYTVEYERVETAASMQAALLEKPWDIVLSDFRMPHFSGTEALEILKQSGIDIPFIMVSGAIGEERAVEAMKAGAQDYIMKNNLRRLLPALERELRDWGIRAERKRLEQMQVESERRYREIFEHTSDALYLLEVSEDGRFRHLDVNPAFEKSFGISRDLLVGKIQEETLPEATAQKVNALYNSCIQLGTITNDELELDLPSGKRVFYSTLVPVRNEAGRIHRIVGISRDITEKYLVEKELDQYRFHLEELVEKRTKELDRTNHLLQTEITKQQLTEKKIKSVLRKEKEINALRAKFISMASHEFRTPLTTIYSSTQLLERYHSTWDEAMIQSQFDRIKEYIHYLVAIIDDVLLVSKVDAKKIKFNPKETDIAPLCTQFKKDIETLLTPKHTFACETHFTQDKYFIDDKLLKLIMSNLLSNAIKYSPDGGTITLRAREENRSMVFTVSDEGIGIPRDDQRYLFEPFHRGKNIGDISGTGLGMSIVKKAVDMHKGKIHYRSDSKTGTTFTITLPTGTA